MSIPDTGTTGRPGVKTLAVRLELDLHAQLSLIAQLRGATITDEIRAAIEDRIAAAKAMPDLAGRAQAVLQDIERDATIRRGAITALFGTTEPAPTAEPERAASPAAGKQPRGRRGGSEDIADS
jgi:hypothetical protein